MTLCGIEIAVEPLDRSAEEYAVGLSRHELAFADGLTDGRRREWLAWRRLLRSKAEAWGLSSDQLKVEYTRFGEPVFADMHGHLSVSHCRGYVALAYVCEGRCGIDVEMADRPFGKVRRRYLSADEMALTGAEHPLFMAAAWCAKEALYKCLGRSGVDFVADMRIAAVDLESGVIAVEAFGRAYDVAVTRLDGAVMAVTHD